MKIKLISDHTPLKPYSGTSVFPKVAVETSGAKSTESSWLTLAAFLLLDAVEATPLPLELVEVPEPLLAILEEVLRLDEALAGELVDVLELAGGGGAELELAGTAAHWAYKITS